MRGDAAPIVASGAGPGVIVISGVTRGQRSSLEITGERGDTLIWRAHENVATTIHEVKAAVFSERRVSVAGGALAILSVAWIASESVAVGACGLVVATGLLTWRALRPSRWLALVLGDRRLVMRVSHACRDDARALTARIAHRLASGDTPAPPSALP